MGSERCHTINIHVSRVCSQGRIHVCLSNKGPGPSTQLANSGIQVFHSEKKKRGWMNGWIDEWMDAWMDE